MLVKARKLQANSRRPTPATRFPPLDVIDRVPRMLQAPELTDGLPFADASEPIRDADVVKELRLAASLRVAA